MQQLQAQVNRINDKLQTLLRHYQHLQKENTRLKKSLEAAENSLKTKGDQVEQLEQRAAANAVANPLWNESDKAQLEKRLNHYIREIDRCMAMLNE